MPIYLLTRRKRIGRRTPTSYIKSRREALKIAKKYRKKYHKPLYVWKIGKIEYIKRKLR
jgi:hypothetical protein